MHLDKGLRQVLAQPRAHASAGSWCAIDPRMRPVLRRSGRAAVVSVRSTGTSGATNRALRSLEKNPPSAKKRDCGASPARSGHCTGISASNASSETELNAPISKSRLPPFSNAESAAVLAENIRRRVEIEPRAKSQPLGDLGHNPPIGLGLTRRRQERPLPRDAALPSWSPCRISRPRPAPAAAHARRN